MSNVVAPIIEAAMSLRAANPGAWTQFLEALDSRATDLAMQTVAAPRDHVQIAQGRAQEGAGFAKAMRDAPKTYENAKRNAHVRQQQPNPARPGTFPAGT